ncbi:MAG: flagellin, partial [Pseudomonadota bacterium]
MSASVLTNSSAMIALQTLRSTNSNLEQVNSQISTGKKIATAKDGAAVFAISKVMESDVAGFQAISDSLNLGAATVSVASNAANQVGELLNEIKSQIVAANEDNVDRVTIQNEIVSLRSQVEGIVNAAQFNGLNLLDNSVASATILSSLDRDATGNVTASNITVTAQNLGTAAGAVRGGLAGSSGVTVMLLAVTLPVASRSREDR